MAETTIVSREKSRNNAYLKQISCTSWPAHLPDPMLCDYYLWLCFTDIYKTITHVEELCGTQDHQFLNNNFEQSGYVRKSPTASTQTPAHPAHSLGSHFQNLFFKAC